ncbi:class I SAM-dependent methyltransferase [Cohnella faecalis]|uniref:class I SAM-dependent methyltransferase n=1 Tax=Cohnella faecalis TaxID=2315694 RepID=UPI00361768C5
MNDHYYSSKPTSASDKNTFEKELRGHRLRFTSDAGVFSRDGIDYGSRVLIAMMEIKSDSAVLDVGCGYGPIGLTAAKLTPQGRVTLIDVNERAVELARSNASANGIRNVEFAVSDLFSSMNDRRFDVIVSNPPIRAGKAVVHRLLEEAYEHLNPGGSLWIVIQNKQGAPTARAKLEDIFGNDAVTEVGKDKGYRVYRASR